MGRECSRGRLASHEALAAPLAPSADGEPAAGDCRDSFLDPNVDSQGWLWRSRVTNPRAQMRAPKTTCPHRAQTQKRPTRMRTMPSSGCPSLEALGESGGCSHHLCTGTTRETRWSLKQISSRLEVLQCGGADRIFETDSIDFHLQTEPEWVQENLPFGSLCGEEEDDGNVESPSGETRLDKPSAGLVSFPRRTFFLMRGWLRKEEKAGPVMLHQPPYKGSTRGTPDPEGPPEVGGVRNTSSEAGPEGALGAHLLGPHKLLGMKRPYLHI